MQPTDPFILAELMASLENMPEAIVVKKPHGGYLLLVNVDDEVGRSLHDDEAAWEVASDILDALQAAIGYEPLAGAE